MANKPSGLGRGLEELLEDNAPEIKTSSGASIRDGGTPIRINPGYKSPYDTKPKELYPSGHKNRSVKQNFKK